MPQHIYSRAEWEIIARMIAEGDAGAVPPGLAQRIAALLRATPGSWPNEQCTLDLDPASAELVTSLAAPRRGLADAERIISTHQEGNPAASHRIELRSNGVRSVVAYLTDTTTLHRELERHVRRLVATGAVGHLALVEQASLEVLATAALLPEEGVD